MAAAGPHGRGPVGPSLSLSGRVPGRNHLPSPITPAEGDGPESVSRGI